MKSKRARNKAFFPFDFNAVEIENHDTRDVETLAAVPVQADGVTVYFRNLEIQLRQHIQQADAVLGCVAWLTSESILDALAEKDPVAIIVQKEDFLRPDVDSKRGWATDLRRRYDRLRCSWERHQMPGLVSSLSYAGDTAIQPVRCVGNHNRDKLPAFPRMHHKFVVLCTIQSHRTWDFVWNDATQSLEEGSITTSALHPYAIWTGSFNFTENGNRSLENALLLTHPDIVQAYTEEWARIQALSEPLDWENDWIAPEWRIGS